MRVVKVSCPGCGSALIIGEDAKTTTCVQCGSSIILDWEGQTSAAVHLELGKTFLQAGEYLKAVGYFSRALERGAYNGAAWFWMGVATLLKSALPSYNHVNRIDQANIYLHKSGFNDEEAVEALTGWMEGSGPWEDGVIRRACCVADSGGLQGREESRWHEIFYQALSNFETALGL